MDRAAPKKSRSTLVLFVIILVLVVLGAAGRISDNADLTPAQFTKKHGSTSAEGIAQVLVNKTHPLIPATFVPSQLVVPNVPLRDNITDDEKQVSKVIQVPLQQLFAAALKDGVTLNLQSGYRSYSSQVALYNQYVADQGQAEADMYSAKPGHSEHQTGLAFDAGGLSKPECNIQACYAETSEGKWLQQNSYKYGFIVRYPKDKQGITGYNYEPWHLRYIGAKDAKAFGKNPALTLEEFYKQK
ncbi:MAG: M15 family metallopeptidase [Patescibacteria group bacterium]|nr:M15 family metallopeptidase [Patescibacteria group bacterium]